MKKENIVDMLPIVPCHKCGKKAPWKFTEEKLVWGCLYCGNLIYFRFGALEQQIDKVKTSLNRGNEFVHTLEGDGLKPKKDEQLKRLRYRKLI